MLWLDVSLEEVGTAADMYSAGVVLYEMVTDYDVMFEGKERPSVGAWWSFGKRPQAVDALEGNARSAPKCFVGARVVGRGGTSRRARAVRGASGPGVCCDASPTFRTLGDPTFTANIRFAIERNDWTFNWFVDFVNTVNLIQRRRP